MGYGGFDSYGGYGSYIGSYGGSSAAFYGGYGYGYGFGGPMYGGGAYGGSSSYGAPSGYGVSGFMLVIEAMEEAVPARCPAAQAAARRPRLPPAATCLALAEHLARGRGPCRGLAHWPTASRPPHRAR
ncbi:hypothetical protein NL676_001431 [Syzygium grande]|nr:hypothetical protein NL676_001431 [Syzygium grande]